MARTYLLSGPDGSGKTTFAVADATPDSPVAYKGMEPGGFERATKRLKLGEGAILNEYFPPPEDELENLLGGIPLISGGGKVDFRYELDGWVKLLSDIANSMMASSKVGQRPVFDTATRLWLIIRNAFQEMCQKTTAADFEKLDQQKYTWPNKVHMQMHEFPYKYELDVIWVAHQDTVFRSDPPVYKADCWRELPGMVDVHLVFTIENGVPVGRIDKGAEVGMTVRGLKIPEPTLSKVNSILDVVGVLEAEGLEVPKDSGELLVLAGMRGL